MTAGPLYDDLLPASNMSSGMFTETTECEQLSGKRCTAFADFLLEISVGVTLERNLAWEPRGRMLDPPPIGPGPYRCGHSFLSAARSLWIGVLWASRD